MTLPSDTKPGVLRRIFRSPLVRIPLLGYIMLMMMGLNTDILVTYAQDPSKSIQHILAIAFGGFAVYIGYARFFENRPVSELASPGMGRPLFVGILIGAGLYSLCVAILMGMGIYHTDGLNPWSFMLPAISMAISSGVFEELLFRGVLYRSVENWFGSWAALVVSALVFGLTHLMNPQGTIEGALFIAVEAGILLAAAVMLTGRLWLSMGFHMAWNYTQSGIFSGIVSGNDAAQGLLKSTIKGPDYLTGGNFGLESSIIALVICTSTGIIMLIMAKKRGKIIPPCWKRPAA